MGEFLSVAVVIFVALFSSVLAAKKKKQQQKAKTKARGGGRRSAPAPGKPVRPAGPASARPATAPRKIRGRKALPELEDDSNDWLARQLEEERKAYRAVSEMFEVRLSHMANCQAENLRLEHTLHCDAKEVARVSRK